MDRCQGHPVPAEVRGRKSGFQAEQIVVKIYENVLPEPQRKEVYDFLVDPVVLESCSRL
jgi:hypothetical protein